MGDIDLQNEINTRATSGSIYSNFGTSNGYKFIVEWKRNSVDTAKNKSHITATVYLQSSGSSYTIKEDIKSLGSGKPTKIAQVARVIPKRPKVMGSILT